jgi:Tetracyclin repressor-like, C-terminal domain
MAISDRHGNHEAHEAGAGQRGANHVRLLPSVAKPLPIFSVGSRTGSLERIEAKKPTTGPLELGLFQPNLVHRMGKDPVHEVHGHEKRERAVVGSVDYRRVRGDWRSVLTECFGALRQACLAHPGAVPLVESAEVLPAAVFRPMEITLTTLEGVGFDLEDAMRAYSLLTTFTLGQVSYQVKGWARGVDPATAVREGRISPESLPAVTRFTRRRSWDFDRAFKFGLSVILTGLDAKLHRR